MLLIGRATTSSAAAALAAAQSVAPQSVYASRHAGTLSPLSSSTSAPAAASCLSARGTTLHLLRLPTSLGRSLSSKMAAANISSTAVAAAAGKSKKLITLETLNPCIKKMEYAVRGALVIRAAEIEKELEKGEKKPFKNVIRANIGDCHAMGQIPISFIRQVLALCVLPEELKGDVRFEQDIKDRASRILQSCKGGSLGAYSDSAGVEVIREDVARYITRRDNGIPADPLNILMCGGASDGIRAVMKLFRQPDGDTKTGVMIPIPQYPLYSATIAELNMQQVGYYLHEEDAWSLTVPELERAVAEAKTHCNPRAIVVINPGNPTGQVLRRANIEEIIRFAKREGLFIFADEVYQDNIYAPDRQFHSFKQVATEMDDGAYAKTELASFHSASKGWMGECGMRGGYAEIINIDQQVRAMLMKSISAKLCPTICGQTVMDCVVNPPQPGEPSYDTFNKEKQAVLQSLAQRAKLVHSRLNGLKGVSCNVVQGAMYAFPQLRLPAGFLSRAKELGQEPDFLYAMQLLESKGICVVPGSGFGQQPGTYHLRMTILPQPPALKEFLERLEEFHTELMEEYS